MWATDCITCSKLSRKISAMRASKAARDKEDTMNHDDSTNKENTLATELEARVVAWVSGEASAFEAAELERLATDKPELAIFKRRMQAMQGLVAEAVRPDKDPLQL